MAAFRLGAMEPRRSAMARATGRLAGRTVLITGASQGLGRAIALACALEGADLLLVARRAGPLEEARAAAESLGARAIALAADVGDPSEAERVAAAALDAFDRVDVLVNNASELGPTPMPYLIDTDPDALRRVLEVNLLGPFLLTRALLGPMLAAGSGSVINLSSDAGVVGYPGWGAYGGARAAPRRCAPAGDRPGHRSRPALPLLRPPATAGAWGPAGRQRLAHAAGEPDRLDGDGRAAGAAPGRPRRRALGRVGAGRARAGRPGAGPHRRPPAGSGTGPWRAPDLRRRSGGAGARPARGGAGDGVGLFRSLLRSAAGGAAPGRAAGALRLRAGALGPAPLPDAVRGRPGIGRDAERRPALHGPDAARAARPRRGARHHQPARRAVHLRRPRGRPALRGGRAVPRPRGDRRRRGPMPRRRRAGDLDRHHRGPDAGDRRRPQRAGATGRRRHPAPHRPRPPAPRRRRPADRPPRARGQPSRPAAGVPVVRDAAGRLRRGLARGLPLARVRRRLPDRAADQESVTVAHLGCVTVAGLASNAKARRRRRRAAAGPSNL